MFGTLGGPELFLILVVALIVFGPRKLPEIGKSMGKMLAEFRKASNDFQRTIEDEVEAEKIREPRASSRRRSTPRRPSEPPRGRRRPAAAAPSRGVRRPPSPSGRRRAARRAAARSSRK